MILCDPNYISTFVQLPTVMQQQNTKPLVSSFAMLINMPCLGRSMGAPNRASYAPDLSMEALDGLRDRREAAFAPHPHHTPLVPKPDMTLTIVVHERDRRLSSRIFKLNDSISGKVVHVQVAPHSSSNVPPNLHGYLSKHHRSTLQKSSRQERLVGSTCKTECVT